MRLSACRHFLVIFSLVAKDDNELGFRLVVVLGFFFQLQLSSEFFSFVVEDHNEPKTRLISVLGCFALIIEDNNELPTHCHFLHFFHQKRNNDESKASSSSCGFFPQVLKTTTNQDVGLLSSLVVLLQLQNTTMNLPAHCRFLHFFLEVQKTMTSLSTCRRLLVFFFMCIR